MSRRPVKSSGFSLMEVLVALVLLSMIAAATSQALRLGIQFWNATQRDDVMREHQRVASMIEGWIATALPPLAFDFEGRPVFEGKADRLSFLTDRPAGWKLSGYSRITITTQPNPACQRSDLVLIWEDVVAASGFEASETDTQILLRCVHSVTYAYAGVRMSPAGRQFVREDAWADSSALPRLVTLSARNDSDVFTMTARLRYSAD